MSLAFLDFGNFFISSAFDDPVFFVSVVFTVVVSVTLHELGHAWAALAQGDDTPRVMGHLTLDPLVHMGGISLLMLFLVGIAWGATPVNPTRFRGRFGEAIVSFAGPAVNLLLALTGLVALGLWNRVGGPPSSEVSTSFHEFLFVFGSWNVILFLFNLLPIPPLDGSKVVADFSPPYRRWIHDPHNHGVFSVLFLVAFFLSGDAFAGVLRGCSAFVQIVAGA
jgi:Zn-dependent protease